MIKMEVLNLNIEDKVIEYIKHREELIPLVHLLSNLIELQQNNTGFTNKELAWLANNIEVIPKIVDSPVCSGLFYLLSLQPSINMYQVAKRLGVYHSSVQHWKKKLMRVFLLKIHPTMSWGREDLCFLNRQEYPNLVNLIVKAIHEQYGNALSKIINVNKNLTLESYLKWKRKN